MKGEERRVKGMKGNEEREEWRGGNITNIGGGDNNMDDIEEKKMKEKEN